MQLHTSPIVYNDHLIRLLTIYMLRYGSALVSSFGAFRKLNNKSRNTCEYAYYYVTMNKQPHAHNTSQCVSSVWWLILQPQITLWCALNHYSWYNRQSTKSRDPLGIPGDSLGIPRDPLGIPRDSLGIPRDSLDIPRDSLGIPRDSLDIPRDSLGIPRDSLGIPRDSLDIPRDSLGIPRDSLGIPMDSRGIPLHLAVAWIIRHMAHVGVLAARHCIFIVIIHGERVWEGLTWIMHSLGKC